uniref:Tetraspanin n=1 Tax=Ciona savignyi TaxID=51511 RepID=H2YZF1_CIOSA
ASPGSYLQSISVGNLKAVTDFLNTAPLLFIIFGAVIFLISLCGCCGAYTEKVWLLKIYKVSLLVILIVLVITAVLTFCFKPSLQIALHVALLNFLQTYNRTSEVLDLVQSQANCCGVDTYMDWSKSPQWLLTAQLKADAAGIVRGSHPVPESCCLEPEPNCGLSSGGNGAQGIYLNGCSKILWLLLSAKGDMVGVSGLAVAGLLLCCVVFSCCVINFASADGGRVASYA